MFKLLESYIISCYIIQKGSNSTPNVSPNCGWIIDSGETGHMIGESTLFSSYISCAGNKKIKIAKDSFEPLQVKIMLCCL